MDKQKKTPNIVEVNGVQVPSMNWVFDQMMAQSCRIDRARYIALFGAITGGISAFTLIFVIAILQIIL